VQFARPIGSFQAVAQRLADAWIDVEAIRLTMWQAAWRLSAELSSPGSQYGDTAIATAKFWAADAGHRVAHTAVHVHGGVGIDVSYPLHRYFAAAKHNEFALGGATTQLRRIGAELAKALHRTKNAYTSFPARACALRSPRVDLPQPPASPTTGNIILHLGTTCLGRAECRRLQGVCMLRRWSILLASFALVFGSALAASTATAAQASGSAVNPGGVMQSGGAGGAPTAHGVSPSSAGASSAGPRYQATSTNWSGYAATSGTYTSVSASWTEPTGTCSRSSQYSSFWVGLDGYNSGSVEQTGTDVDCSGGSARYYAWYEMYPAYPVNYSNTVRPGDHLNASVTYLGNNQFRLFIGDTTQGWSHTTTASLSGAARSSAEVIVEAPSSSSGVLPLADFGTASFTGSTANGSAIGNAGGVTQIIMIDNAGRAKDSISSLSGGQNFSATWLRSN
jgi:hypothetical protein